MQFLVDQDVYYMTIEWLRKEGHDVVTAKWLNPIVIEFVISQSEQTRILLPHRVVRVRRDQPRLSGHTRLTIYRGKKYYFCAPGCKRAFDQNPEKYLTEDKK